MQILKTVIIVDPVVSHTNYSFLMEINMHETVKGKTKELGVKKPRKEFIYGEELYRAKNEWVDKVRIIDRENDHYYEKVVDKLGEVINECEEPLSKHWGHGSANKEK